ncbi:hypothetical protein ACW9HH_14915 [Nocardia gipuzkoensis]
MMVIDVQRGFVVPCSQHVVPVVDHVHVSLAAALNAMLLRPCVSG